MQDKLPLVEGLLCACKRSNYYLVEFIQF